MTVITTVEIPEDLAKQLTRALTKQQIFQSIAESTTSEEKFKMITDDMVENQLMIDGIKSEITNEYIPEEFRSDKFEWRYNGYPTDGNKISIYEA